MITFFKHTLYIPLYNALAALASIMPGNDIGLAIITLTLGVKVLLSPLQHKASKTQVVMKKIEPELSKLKTITNKEEQARKVMALYREHGINPFSSIMLLLIQIPIIITLFYVFKNGFELNLGQLYSFTPQPETINTMFLGLFDIHNRNYILAFLVGITQFIQMRLAIPPLPVDTANKEKTFANDFARSMNIQMRYVMPVMTLVIAATLPAAISIYWITSNIFAIGHELIVKRLVKEDRF